MAKRKLWYHYTAELMLLLFITGTIAVTDLPNYYCDVEDKFKGCMFLKDNNATCVFPINVAGNNWTYAGDRCQAGQTRSTWQLTEEFVRIPIDRSDPLLAKPIEHIQRPIVMTNTKVYKDTRDKLYVEGFCRSAIIK